MPQADIRRLPSFGSPNEFPNPPTHFFPSKPGAFAARIAAQQQAQAQAQAKAQAASETGGDSHHVEGTSAQAPMATSRSSTSSLRSRDRVTWDAGSELMREEQQIQRTQHVTQNSDETVRTVNAITGSNKRKNSPEQEDELEDDVDGDDGDGDGDGDDAMDGATTGDSPTQSSSKDAGAGSKKRSRTLTTAHQTAVLNALLAKTRFPSTETREEVGKQIGMSARRVQIWFQNRRQSQKRARDREATDLGGSAAGVHHPHYDMYYMHNPPQSAGPMSQYHPTQQQQHQHVNSPYGHHPTFPGPPSNSTASTTRPGLDRHLSVDSVGSYASAHSSMSSFHTAHVHQREGGHPSDNAPRWPGNPAPISYGPGWQHSPGIQSPSSEHGARSGTYFPSHFPPAPRVIHQRPPGDTSTPTNGDSVRLPSLSVVLGPSMPDAPESPYGGTHSSASSMNRPNWFPSATRGHQLDKSGPAGRSILSPTPTSSARQPVDESGFARLRISTETPVSPPPAVNGSSARQSTPPDVLDAAMEMMHRPTHINPPRSSLPPLRMPPTHRGAGPSEADAALSAPILPAIRSRPPGASVGYLLPSISSLTGDAVFPSRADTTLAPSLGPSTRSDHGSSNTAASRSKSQQVMHTIPVGGSLTTWTTSSARYESATPTSPASSLALPTPSSAPTRSSVSSVDTSTGWAWNTPVAGITRNTRSDSVLTPSSVSSASAASSTSFGGAGSGAGAGVGVGGSSFSHEVQEEWARISSSGHGVRKVVPAQVVDPGPDAKVDAEGDVTMN